MIIMMIYIYLDIFIYHGIGIAKRREKLVVDKATVYCVATYRIFVYGKRGRVISIWLDLCDVYVWYGCILMGLL